MFQATVSDSGLITYIIANLACVLFMLPMIRKIKTTVGSQMEAELFFVMICIFLVHIVTDSLMLFFSEINLAFPYWACNVITIIDEISVLLVGFFWFLFGWVRMQLSCLQKILFKVLISLPVMIDVVLSVSSPWTGFLFQINDAGVYQRGPLYFIQAGTVFFYIILISCAAMYKANKIKSPSEKNKALSLIKFIIAPSIAGILQIINHNTPIMNLGLTLGIYYVYTDMLDMQIFNDSLTGMNNRRRAQYYLSDSLEEAAENPFYVFMIDIDYFKNINDAYGHSEGDRALCVVADALKETAAVYNGFAARLGGDEFLMSAYISSGVIPERVAGMINEKIKNACTAQNLPYTVNLSVGYMKCDKEHADFAEVLRKADEMQYLHKREHHKTEE